MASNVLVRMLCGRSVVLNFESSGDATCDAIKARVEKIEGIPSNVQRLVTGTRQLQDGDGLESGEATVHVLLRLLGGKGGFGSLLRGAATGGRHKKTSNFDACRDMSGRRLRHVNAEKKLKEWQEEAPLRALEKVAEDYIRNESIKKKVESDIAKDIEKFREQTEKNMEDVEAAVLDGLKQADLKRKNVDPIDRKAKRVRLAFEEDSDDDDEDDDLFSEPLFGSSSGSTSRSDDSQDEEMTDREEEDKEDPEAATTTLNPLVVDVMTAVETPVEAPEEPVKVEEIAEVPEKVEEIAKVPEKVEEKASVEEPAALNLENFSSAEALEVLGLEKLKVELQRRGLKCGGNLRERAARLFLLNTTPIDKIDKKHFAKSK